MAASLNLVPSQHLTANAPGTPALHLGTVTEDQRCP